MHVVVVADSRYPIAEPFAGGMQAMTWHLVRGLRARGVDVTLFAGPGSDSSLDARTLEVGPVLVSETARSDVSMPPEAWLEQHHAYLRLVVELAGRPDVDVVHNNSLHPLPVASSPLIPAPVLTTLHTPPTPWLEPAVQHSEDPSDHFVAVSHYTARQWRHAVDAGVVANGIDVDLWPAGPGGEDLVWSGRIVPEKAPHLAIEIARRAGRRLLLAGPRPDPDYWRRAVLPRLDHRAHYVGHLAQAELARLVGGSAAALVTPVWEEPYGLVGAEALSCGTPVVGFARGGLTEMLDPSCSRLVASDDVGAAAAAVEEAAALDRERVRRYALTTCSLTAMVERYLALYERLARRAA